METKETIYFVSDFIFFSSAKDSEKYRDSLEALLEYIKYIKRKASRSFNLDERKWLKLAQQELQRRKRSRLALKFFIALPRKISKFSLFSISQLHKQLRAFLSKEFQVPHKFIAVSFVINSHNPHAHILIFPRKYNGKKLSLSRYALKTFHKNLKNFWEKLGYTLKLKKNPKQKLPHFGKAIEKLPSSISKNGIVLAKLKSPIKIQTIISEKLKENITTFFPYLIIKVNNRYIFTRLGYDNLKYLINNLSKIFASSQAINELWIISNRENTDFLIFLKIKTQKRGGKDERNLCNANA